MRAILCALSATVLSAGPLAAAHAPAAVFRGGSSSSCPPPVRYIPRPAPQRCAPVPVQRHCPPPNTVWVPGAWRQQACGWVYVPGYYAPCRPEPQCRSTISVTWRW